MNTRLYRILIPLVGMLLLTACSMGVINGSGNIRSEARPVGDFSAVNFSGFGEMTLVQGESNALTIETDDNLLPYIKTRVSQGTLTISFDDGLSLLRPSDSIRYKLSVKTLNAFDLSGAGTVESSKLSTDQLTLTESGAGKLKIHHLAASKLIVDMSGAGTMELAGKVASQTVEMSGLGGYQAGDLSSQRAKVSLSGAGEMTVWVSEQLEVDLSGAGRVNYYGSPQTNQSSSGIGSVHRLGDK
jgi:hypothetical protein